jgi:hypothetical protein
MEEALTLVLAGIPVAVLVALGVQGLKVFGVISDAIRAGRAAILLALAFGVLFAVAEMLPDAAVYINLAISTFAGAMVAGLGYQYVAKPILEKFGINVSSEDLNGS